LRFDDNIPVQPQKIEALRQRIARLGLDLSAIEETFVRGGGKGGQKINKTANAVVLRYPPLDLVIKCQRERQRSVNRFLALRELVDKIEMRLVPETSARLSEQDRIRKQKDRRRRRAGG
jgi:protein subunit release factor B